MRVYLDWNATTPPHPDVLAAMRDAPWGNPASIHADGREARAVVEGAREAVAEVDAVQAWSKIEVPTGADTTGVGAHKMRGPKGIGALATRPGVRITPVLLGGSQEKGTRPGTVDAALAAGLGACARRA